MGVEEPGCPGMHGVRLSLTDTMDRDDRHGCAALVGRNGNPACNGSHGRSGSHKECAFQAGYVARLVELCCKDADQQSVRDCGLVPMGGVALFAQGELYVHSEQTR